MIEIWKDISEYEGLYQISNFGRVKSLSRKIYNKNSGKLNRTSKEKYLKLNLCNTGYIRVALSKKDKRNKFMSVHRLVAQAFIPNPENKSQINHKDGDKQNNYYKNLEWSTQSENILHAVDILKTVKSIKDRIKVLQYDLKNNKVINNYNSIKEAGQKTGICKTNISQCSLGKRKSAGGFGWRRVKSLY